jgi:16S rRNA processing protein RimM
MSGMLMTGVITSTHGLKGAFKVYPTTDDVRRFKKLKKVYLLPEEEEDSTRAIEAEVLTCDFFKGRPILRTTAASTVEEAEKLKGLGIFVKREDAVPLSENEYFITDLLGSRILLENGEAYGVLKDILKSAANDVYVVVPDEDKGKEIYIPAVRDYIKEVDPMNKIIRAVIPREI